MLCFLIFFFFTLITVTIVSVGFFFVQIEVVEMDSLDLHHCQSINDPHIRTFDGV